MDLISVKPEDKTLLWNIHQKYLYEMTAFYDDEMDAQGILHYGHFDAYFTDMNRKGVFLCEEKTLVGFALIHSYSELDEKTEYVLAGFTIFPMYRRKHLARKAAEQIFERFKGHWEIKYNEKNIAAKALWNSVTEAYQPRIVHLNPMETVLLFCST